MEYFLRELDGTVQPDEKLEDYKKAFFLFAFNFFLFERIFPDTIKNEFYRIALDHENNNSGNCITNIIVNHMLMSVSPTPKLPDVMLGPCSYYVVTIKGRIFYLFGDIHIGGKQEKDEQCRNNLFHKLVLPYLGSLDKIIDLFTEGSPHYHESMFKGSREREIKRMSETQNDPNTTTSYMGRLYYDIEKCSYPIGQCKYKNLRVHRPDPRDLCLDDEKDPIGCACYHILTAVEEKDDEKMISVLRRVKRLSRHVNNLPVPAFQIYIQKQLDAIEDVDIKRELEHRLSTLVRDTKQFLFPPFDLELIMDTSGMELGSYLESIIDISMPQLDLYFLARCFRNFSGVKSGFPPVPCRYIVAWFGALHIDNIVKILKSMGATVVCKQDLIRTRSFFERCLNYSQLAHPWFGDNLVS
jgi:hypothetical protein